MKKFALCTFGVAAGAVVAAFTQGPVEEMLGYAQKEAPVAEVNSAEQIQSAKADESSLNARSSPEPDFSNEAETVPAVDVKTNDKQLAENGASKEKSSVSNPLSATSESASVEPSKPEPVSIAKKERPKKTVAKKAEQTLAVNKEASRKSSSQSAARKKQPAVAIGKSKSSSSSKDAKVNPANKGGKADLAEGDKAPSIRKAKVTASSNNAAKNSSRQKVVVAKPPIKPLETNGAKKTATADTNEIELSGKFSVVSATHAGKEIALERLGQMSLEFEDGRIAIRQSNKTEVGSIIEGDQFTVGGVSATEIEINSSREGVPPIKGFYFRSGDSLQMVWGRPGRDRPKSLKEKDLTSARVLRLIRANKSD